MDGIEIDNFSSRNMRPDINCKSMIMLLAIFLFVISNFFINNILSGFGDSAIEGGELTTWGLVLQGIFLVMFYVIALYLDKNNYI